MSGRGWLFHGVALGIVLSVIGSGCGHGGGPKYRLEAFPDCRRADTESKEAVARARDEVRAWIASETVERESAFAVRSYPESEGPLSRKSYLYDNALGLLWFSWTGQEATAAGLARTLLERQRSDGSWVTRFDLDDPEQDSETVRHGAVAWAGYALAYYAERGESAAAGRGAGRAAEYLWGTRHRRADGGGRHGLISGGYSGESEERRDAEFASTEHNFDAHMLLARVAPGRASELERRILDRLWLEEAGRFAMGMQADGLDRRRALDAAGAWGSLWLQSIGRDSRARRNLRYVLDHFRASGVDGTGFRPYLDPAGAYEPEDRADHIFVEGTFSVGLAAVRAEFESVAKETLRLGAQLQCMTGGGMPYSNLQTREFAAEPAAAPSFWFLFVEREWRTGKPAPIFRTFRHQSQETDSTDAPT